MLKNKKGIIFGIANDHSIAWGIAKVCADQGAELAFSYQGEQLLKRVKPLAKEAGSNHIIECDVGSSASLDNLFKYLSEKLCTPSEIRLTPAAAKSLSLLSSIDVGFASRPISKFFWVGQ